jgi:hypothetical protein
MDSKEALEWLDKLIAKKPSPTERGAFTAWAGEAESLFSRVFVPSETVFMRYRAALETYMTKPDDWAPKARSVSGFFDACSNVMKEHPDAGMFWSVQVAGSTELLDQAQGILDAGWSDAAAAVLAGGALEQHLLHLCQRFSLQWTGHGSISVYNNAVRSAKAKQAVPYQETDAKQIDAWGGIRNDGAHTPGSFAHDRGEVTRMIEGVRSFLARVQ